MRDHEVEAFMPNRTHITGSEKQLVVSGLNRNRNVKGKS
jgi:hypothetical protein